MYIYTSPVAAARSATWTWDAMAHERNKTVGGVRKTVAIRMGFPEAYGNWFCLSVWCTVHKIVQLEKNTDSVAEV